MVTNPKYRISDYKDIRKTIREFINQTKKKKTIKDKIAFTGFLKEVKMEIDAHLKSRGLLRKK